MDPLAVTLVVTFIVMLGSAAMTMPFQRPPTYRRQLSCPQDQEEASVAFSWDVTQRRMAVMACDHRASGQCHESCVAAVQATFNELRPSVVLP